MKQKKFILPIVFSIISIPIQWCLTGCSITDEYHNKRHLDTIKKDISSAHKDVDRVLGIDEPSPLVEDK